MKKSAILLIAMMIITQSMVIQSSANAALPTVTTTSISGITSSSGISGGNVTDGGGYTVTSRGVCWSTTTGPTVSLSTKTTDGSGLGAFVSNFSGLTPNTTYYLRAYATSSQGTAYGSEIIFTTSGLTCGSSTVTAYHVAGSVAPVAKTVDYATVNNIPGETAKCWITQNLGSTQQATGYADPSEASAGWYWQFNRKQGFKHDGTTRTPATTWITSISENSNWLTANDPCTIELGGNWRLPTGTEWTNVDNAGGWVNNIYSWNSPLKIHMAGFLITSSGALQNRGVASDTWSSTGYNLTDGNDLTSNSSFCYLLNHPKTYGFSVRCINPGTVTVTTTAASAITNSSAILGGVIKNDGSGSITARGVCWSLTTGPTIALSTKTSDGSGDGTFSSQVSGLSPNSTYYIRAYATTAVGTTYGNEQVITTSVITCGTSVITVYHVADSVSPVTKTVAYGTVKNIPGDTSKCWITRNLGASQQAIAVNDASEASAGWYWQFNRKQGFKHDGSTRTPNTTWITSINENSDWLSANDPCNLELGSQWRVPTLTEWNNADNTGGWTNWNGPWLSGLKLHAGGFLAGGSGALSNRGANGYFWSSTQNSNTAGWDMSINSGGSNTDYNPKQSGFSVRCLNNLTTPTLSTTAASSITVTSAISGGNITADGGFSVTARGVCWSTSPLPTIALSTKTSDGSGLGAFTSNISGLNSYTIYYLRAYATNANGTSYGNQITFTTSELICGTSTMTINHVANGIAPVAKTVTYGTATNITGETTKCWLTRNLGASQQATAVNDATEASAGWYWQFNRKQGFKHDGTTRTPNTTWVSSIYENSGWAANNDPCNLELGSFWRLPTYSEWYNIDITGTWTNWNGPWGSGLKLHAAGYLVSTTGARENPGVNGKVWSSSQNGSGNGWFLNFHSGYCAPIDDYKSYGLSVRCLGSLSLPSVSTASIGSITNSSAIASSSVTGNGASAVTARGVCWSTTTGPTIALATKTADGTGVGAFSSNLSGLSPSTLYYVRAYATNSMGTAYGNEMTFTTTDFICGTTAVTAHHLTGSVAPVSKSVDYGTAGNIPGETQKCWITRNLGASQQATAVTDATELSAGWYWQFNRKQGYKHDGTTRTPNTVWITSINEASNWNAANDPCKIELGSMWSIPTSTEWYNIYIAGGWTNWNGPWNSELKLHAGGYLDKTTSALGNRGVFGDSWSSTQISATLSSDMNTGPATCELVYRDKAYAFPVRCLRSLSLPTVTTSVAGNVTNSSAISGGTVSDNGGLATTRGVCWSVSSNPTVSLNSKTIDGTGGGVFTSNLGGLSPNTTYYYRAYATNSMGTVYGNEMTFTTPAITCGTSLVTVYHTANSIAPVTKTVSYGTVKNIPGDTAKCWITRNLGASQQATAVNDATEPSAGWYWQFNRKQGFKVEGTIRTPNTVWITSISESSDWLKINDPCNSELGSGWRIPTFTEWYNVDNTGGWTNWNGPWNSGLKIHGPGYLWIFDGTLSNPGAQGYYWSSTQDGVTNGKALSSSSGGCAVQGLNKSMGSSVRCLNSFDKPTLTTTAIGSLTPASVITGGNITNDDDFNISKRGVCWSTTPGPTTALDTRTDDGSGSGVFSSNISGLDPETVYYIRAYATNCNGTSYGNEITFTTPPFICGTSPLTIYHVADSVAPVTKTVTYQTNKYIPGIKNRCWITKNLGADQQASVVSDNTEPAAGWYWEFNRKQGYRHDGFNVTPNLNWPTSSTPASDWLAVNDPCRQELGTQWRIPTYTEWNGADSAGNWNNGQAAFSSTLKLHYSGYINGNPQGGATLMSRGGYGWFWSSSQLQFQSDWASGLQMESSACVMGSISKNLGLTLRCLREEIPPTTAGFTANTVYGGTPLEVHFTDQTTTSLQPLTWKWYFGDGDSSSLQNPVHIYHHDSADMKTYTVKLVVRDAKDSISIISKTDYIKVCPQVYIPGGNVSGTWHSDSTYYIGGEIIVPYGQTLTIEPGTTVKFRTDSRDSTVMAQPRTRSTVNYGFMTVYGTLIAQGTEADSIRFTRAGNQGWWGHIHFRRVANQQNPFKYCTMEYASYLTDFTPAVDLAGLSLDSNSTAVTNCRFSNNYMGIRSDSSHSVIQFNKISSNTTGILTGSHSAPVIKQNIITGNSGHGIKVTNSGVLKVVSNTLAGNGYGLFTDGTGTITVDNSILWGNTNAFNSSTPTVDYSCVQGGYSGTGNISSDPKFTGSSGDPYGLIWSNFPVKTEPALISPCINTGNPNLNGTGGDWMTDPADRDPDMSRPDMGARYFHQDPLISCYNVPPPGGDSSFYNFGSWQIPSSSTPHAFVVRNDADRLIDCPVVFTGVSANQFHLSNSANSLLHLLPYELRNNIQAYFQPNLVGQQDGYLRAGVTGFQDSIWLQGTGLGTGTVIGYVRTSTGLGVGGVTITVHKLPSGANYTGTTGPDGYYSVTNVGYGDFSVTPSKTGSGGSHTFNPVSATVTLVSTAPVNKDFTDVSYFTVSGQVTFKNSNCPSPGVAILLDNVPKATTNQNGEYTLNDVQIGIHTIKPDPTYGHTFTPTSIIDTVLYPQSGINFEDKFTHNLSGKVVGGCDIPLADSVMVVVTCLDNCKPPVTTYTDSTGQYSLNLPPFKYNVTAGPVSSQNTTIIFEQKEADLRNSDTVQNFVYHSLPFVEITGFEPYTDNLGWTIIEQFNQYSIGVSVYEPYYTPQGELVKCRVDTGNVFILDDLSDTGLDTIALSDSASVYTFYAGLPNILAGGNHPYQKSLQAQFIKDGNTATTEKWVYVVGQRPRNTAYTTTTPELPLLVLHDPPGDNSYSYFSNTTTVSQAISFGMKRVLGGGASIKASLGLDFQFSTGFVYEQTTNINVTLDFTASIDLLMTQNSVKENKLTFITNSMYSTSADESFVGRSGDLYMGGAMNLLYGITDILTITDHVVSINPDIIIVPKGFATTYIYSENEITTNIIPSLYLIGDTASAHRWERFVLRNTLLPNYAQFKENISFSAGANSQYSETLECSATTTEEFELQIDSKVAAEVGITVDGLGVTGGVYVSTSFTTGKSVVTSSTNSNTIGFALADNDPGDDCTLDVLIDPVYGTPVFVTKSGRSSCPYETGTVLRDECSISPSVSSQSGVNPSSSAFFTVNLNNTSQTTETRDYQLRVVNSSNPHGALIMAGGQSLSTPVTYTLAPNNSLAVSIYISMPPGGEVYDFTGIQIVLESVCDAGISDTATFHVHFTPPCSPVNILIPGNNWVINQASNHILPVTITGYDTTNTQLQEINLEYSANSGNSWIKVFSIPKSSIHSASLLVNWNVTGYSDGAYMIRAVAKCEGTTVNYSERLSGVIDTQEPEVVGVPLPSDGILITGDEISCTFTEPLNPATITINSCRILNAATGQPLSANVQYIANTNKILFTLSPGLNYFIENRYLTAQIAGVADRYGNPMPNAINWTFLVDQGPLHWSPNSFPFSVSGPESFNFNSYLTNNSANQVYYSILTPGTITPSIFNGYLSAAGGNVSVGFTTDTMNQGNPHYDTIFASCLGYPEEKIFVSYSSPGFIEFGVDSTERHVSAEAGNTMFLISSNLAWSVTEGSEWLSVTPGFGYNSDTIFVTYDANPNNAVRTATITVKAEGVPVPTKILSVIQAPAAPVVPPIANVQNVTTAAGQTNCYNATQTITVAGNSTTFIVQNQGTANFIAGQAIYLKTGTKVFSGGRLTAKIAPSGPWCTTTKIAAELTEIPTLPEPEGKSLFVVYPNPANGNFTVACRGVQFDEPVRIEVWSQTGNQVIRDQMTGSKHEMEFREMAAGMYFVRIVTSKQVETVKLIKTR
jgi:hypothetical protein